MCTCYVYRNKAMIHETQSVVSNILSGYVSKSDFKRVSASVSVEDEEIMAECTLLAELT